MRRPAGMGPHSFILEAVWDRGSGGCGLHTYSQLLCTVPQMERRQWECGSPSSEAGIQRSVVAELGSGEPSSVCLLPVLSPSSEIRDLPGWVLLLQPL